ncbi:hypothetical protein JIN82_03670 [Persicirhabdus sediminis]|uniref:Uncharacterized protein n=2 Tax=Persicirhabdus sediminis TaxID=454144 RepID=A0A8J7MCZ7_9BACT|nr:hypothetical protein [Persicirhabdus sediminis]
MIPWYQLGDLLASILGKFTLNHNRALTSLDMTRLFSLIAIHLFLGSAPLHAEDIDMSEVFADREQATAIISSFIESARTQDFGIASSGRNSRTLIKYADHLDFSKLGIPQLKYLTLKSLPDTSAYPHKDLVLTIHNISRDKNTWSIKATYFTFQQNSISSPNANFTIRKEDGKFSSKLDFAFD